MALTMHQANKRLEKAKTAEDLRNIIERLEVSSPGSVTLLYSGSYGYPSSISSEKIAAGELARSIASVNSEVRLLDNSEAARFLDISDKYGQANYSLLDALKQVFGDDPNKYGTKANQFLYGEIVDGVRVPNGAWDIVSARFVENTVGPVVTLTGGADPQRVFAQTELPRLLENRKVTTIDGLPRTALEPLGVQAAFEAIRAQSEVKASEIRIAVDEAGRPRVAQDGTYLLDARTYLGDLPEVDARGIDDILPTRALADFVPADRLPSHAEGLDQLRKIQAEMLDAVDPGSGTKGVLKGLQTLDHLGGVIDVLSLALAARDAKEAFDRGDRAGAQSILTEWALEFAGAMVAGRLAAMVAAPLIAAGPLGILLAAGLTIGASAAGAMFADDLVRLLWPSILQFHEDLLEDLEQSFAMAERMASPLILDLDGDGIETLAEAEAGIHFDHDANGYAERTGWVAPDDGLLVIDLDGNGTIDSGRELFGTETLLPNGSKAANGFEALKVLDLNRDGRLDAVDPAWQDLRLWRDLDSNGLVDSDELQPLEQSAVQELQLAYSVSQHIDEQGNHHRQLGHYQLSDGTQRDLVDVWFAFDPARSVFLAEVPVSAEIRALPDLPGSGTVPSLHQVLMANPGGILEGLVRDWVTGDSGQRAALMEDLVFHWTGVENFTDQSSTYNLLPRRRLAALEKLLGVTFREGWADPVPGYRVFAVSNQAFGRLVEVLESMFITQVEVPLLLQANAGGGDVIEVLRGLHGESADGVRLLKIGWTLDRLGEPAQELRAVIDFRAAGETGLFGVHLRAMSFVDNTSFGTDGDEVVQGLVHTNDWLEGRAGHDYITAWAGDDLLIGGPGNDKLHGGLGSDLYAFGRGDGIDSLFDQDSNPGDRDEVTFMDIRSDQVEAVRLGHDLQLHYGEADLVTVVNQFLSEAHGIEVFHFADGISWEAQDLVAMLAPDPVLA